MNHLLYVLADLFVMGVVGAILISRVTPKTDGETAVLIILIVFWPIALGLIVGGFIFDQFS